MYNTWEQGQGAEFYCITKAGSCKQICVDINVESDASTVTLNADKFQLRDCKKSFPNVTELIIEKRVMSIDIPNSLFPNIKSVTSLSSLFCSGEMLVKKDYFYGTLLNSFYKTPNSIIDMHRIGHIANYAFEGCLATKMINISNVTQISATAFAGSAFMSLPFENGIKLIGTVLIDVDENADEIILPQSPCITSISKNVNPGKINKMRVKCFDSLAQFKTFSKTIILDCKKINLTKLMNTFGGCAGATSIENIISEMPQFQTMDGILYSSDKKALIFCPRKRGGDIIIPEGVTRIRERAFECSQIKSVKLPDSLVSIETKAFSRTCLEKIDFGNGLTQIGGNGQKGVFSNCYNLKEVEIPSQVELIGHQAFMSCEKLEKVKLNEGLKEIKTYAFHGDLSLHEITLPDSIKEIGAEAFFANNAAMKRIYTNVLPNGLVRSVIRSSCAYGITPLEIIYKGRKIILPRGMNPYRISDCCYHFNMNQLSDTFVNSLFCYASDSQKRVVTAYAIYKNTKDEEAKEELKKDYAMKVMLEFSEKRFIDYLSLDFVRPDAKKMLDILGRKEWFVAKAYMMEKAKNYAKPDFAV